MVVPPRRQQWQVLLAISGGYLFYYTGRQNFGWAIPGLQADLGLTATEIGWISGSGMLAYALAQVVSGHLSDRYGGQRVVVAGAVLSCALNWVASFSAGFWSLAVAWFLNNVAQSMGFAPGSRLVAGWWPGPDRGRAFGIFNFAAGLSSVVTFALALAVLAVLPWPWVFRLPVLLMLVGAAVVLRLAPDPPTQGNAGEGAPAPGPGDEPRAGALWALAVADPRVLLAALSFGFANWGRLTLLVWVPAHVLSGAGTAPGTALTLPLGMAAGALIGGWVADRWLHGNHRRMIALSLSCASVAVVAVGLVPARPAGLATALLFVAGFFLLGSSASYSALSANLVDRRILGFGVGLVNGVGYGTAAVGELIIGAAIDATGTTAVIFPISAAACLLGAGTVLAITGTLNLRTPTATP